MNDTAPSDGFTNLPFPIGAEHVVGGGADGEPFVQPFLGSPSNIMLSQHQQQVLQQQVRFAAVLLWPARFPGEFYQLM